MLQKVPDRENAMRIINEAIPVMQKCIQVIKDDGFFQQRKIIVSDQMKSIIVNPIFYKFFVKSKKFKVSEKCISCGKCVRVCPLNNVQLEKEIPRWGNCCTYCMACISGCPKEAIEYGKSSVGQPRYQCSPYRRQKVD